MLLLTPKEVHISLSLYFNEMGAISIEKKNLFREIMYFIC